MNQPVPYRIRVRSQVASSWFDAFEGLRVSATEDETRLEGPFPDQAALHGLIALIRDLGLTLLSVERLSP